MRPLRSWYRRGRELGVRRLMLLVKTFWLLLGAKVALRLVAVKRIMDWQEKPVRGEKAEGGVAADLAEVRHAVLVVARYSPVRFVCFPQCLAASALLKGRGIASRLHYGVARDGAKLITHTWLEAGGEMVIGGEVAGQYSELAVYARRAS